MKILALAAVAAALVSVTLPVTSAEATTVVNLEKIELLSPAPRVQFNFFDGSSTKIIDTRSGVFKMTPEGWEAFLAYCVQLDKTMPSGTVDINATIMSASSYFTSLGISASTQRVIAGFAKYGFGLAEGSSDHGAVQMGIWRNMPGVTFNSSLPFYSNTSALNARATEILLGFNASSVAPSVLDSLSVVCAPGMQCAITDWKVPSGAVPEPATWAMLIIGFGVIGFAARRRRPAAMATVSA